MNNIEIQVQDFSKNRNFPGTANNELDVILHQFEGIQRIPSLVFGFLLLAGAIFISRLNWQFGLVLWGFFLSDWLLLVLLPRFGKSFGPPKPTVVLLAIARGLVALLPWQVSFPLQILGTGLVIYGFWIEPHTIRVTRQFLSSNKLKPETRFRILHLGDLHIERITHREIQLNELIKSLSPDIILFSGDFLNLSYLKDGQAKQDVRNVIQEWKAPLGVFGVTGSPAVDLEEDMPALLEGLPIRRLQEENLEIKVGNDIIHLTGLSCSHKPFEDFPSLRKLIPKQPEEFTILLYHSPDLAPQTADLGIDLQLSGHTHGGQVRIPLFGALITGSLYGRRFQSGRYQLRDLALYITRGIGMEGAGAPRVRFLCPPEIILWEIAGI